MNEMRDRLIELLAKYFTIGDSYAYNLTRVKEAFAVGTVTIDDFVEFDDEVVADIADYLLANNAIRLPCKVGDTVYLSEWWNSNKWEKQPCPIERRVRYFSIEDDGIYAHLKDGCINVKYFDKIVFLTREEAEKALREKENG